MEAEQLLDRQALHVLGNLSKPDTRVKRHTSSSPLTLSLRPSPEPQSALPKQRPSQRRGLRGRALMAASGSLCAPRDEEQQCRRRTAWWPQPAASIPPPSSRRGRPYPPPVAGASMQGPSFSLAHSS